MSFFDPLQGTEIIPLLTSALNDELHWKTPDQFNPSHFLDADGNFIKKEAFIPFSVGERGSACTTWGWANGRVPAESWKVRKVGTENIGQGTSGHLSCPPLL